MRRFSIQLAAVLLAAATIFTIPAHGQGAAILFPQAIGSNGTPLPFWTITFCSMPTTISSTGACTTPATVYTNQTLTTPFSSAILTDGQGFFPPNTINGVQQPQIWFAAGTYCYTLSNVNMSSPATNQCVPFSIQPGSGGAFTTLTANNAIFAGPNPWIDITSAGYGADPTGSADSTTALLTAWNVLQSGNGGTLYAPCGTYKFASQITAPNNGANPPLQKTVRLVGCGSGGVIQFFPDNGCNGGTIFNMTFNAPVAKFLSLGLGKLEIAGICFEDTNTDFTPFFLNTLTVLQFHNNQVYGNTGHFPAGCCSVNPPTQDGQTGIILGGQGTTTSGSTTDMFQGYGTSIDHNQFDYCGQCVRLQNQTNSVNVESNHFFNHITNTTHGPITIDPGAAGGNATFRTAITNNLIEVGASKYGIHLVQNVHGYYIAGNACWDSNNVGVVTFACVREEPSAGNAGSFVITVQQDSNTGTPLPDQITSSSSRQQNGRFLGAAAITDCTKPMFGASNTDTVGMTISGGAKLMCSNSAISMVFDNNAAGDDEMGTGGCTGWQSTAAPSVGGTPDTQICHPTSGVASVDTGTPGNAAGKLRLSQIQSASGTATMGLTLKKGTGAGNYTSSSTSYVAVDGTNLALTVTIPTGWKLMINASGTASVSTAIASLGFALADGGNVVCEQFVVPQGTGLGTAFALNWIITGDGASHTVDLRYKTGAGADAVNISNNSSTLLPTMTFTLMPSN
jgi:hypothetical protein